MAPAPVAAAVGVDARKLPVELRLHRRPGSRVNRLSRLEPHLISPHRSAVDTALVPARGDGVERLVQLHALLGDPRAEK